MSLSKIVSLKNPHLAKLDSDFLYHLGFNSTDDLKTKFGDVRFVCMGGTQKRMKELAEYLQGVLNISGELKDLCETARRFALFKVGPVLCVSHGIGMPSMSILLHEMAKLVFYAECVDPIFIRIGTSGGLEVDIGTVVITEKAYNGYLRNEHVLPILGKAVHRPATFRRDICEEILRNSKPSDDFKTVIGNTLAADDFYEGQARTDGAIATHDDVAKMEFLNEANKSYGILNIEMEATMFASFTSHLGIKSADVCVTLVNRLIGDQVTQTNVSTHDLEKSPFIIVGRFIKTTLDSN